MARVTYTLYRIVLNRKHVHVGITRRPEEREKEHQRVFGSNAYMVVEGHRYSLAAARQWEDEQRRKGRPTGP